MEHITREEMIGLLKESACPEDCDNGAILTVEPSCCGRPQSNGECCGDPEPVQGRAQCQFCHERERAIAALQAAEPAAWQFYEDGEWHSGDRKIAGYRRNTEAAGIPVRDLFALPCPPDKAQVPDEALNIVEGIRAELTWPGWRPGWRSTRSRDWVVYRISELLSMLTAAPQPAETEEKSRD